MAQNIEEWRTKTGSRKTSFKLTFTFFTNPVLEHGITQQSVTVTAVFPASSFCTSGHRNEKNIDPLILLQVRWQNQHIS